MTSKLTSFSFQPPFFFLSHGIFNFHFQLAQAFGPKVLKVRARHDLESESNSQRASGQYSPPSLFLTLVRRGKCLWMRGWVLENVPQQQRSKGWFITQEEMSKEREMLAISFSIVIQRPVAFLSGFCLTLIPCYQSGRFHGHLIVSLSFYARISSFKNVHYLRISYDTFWSYAFPSFQLLLILTCPFSSDLKFFLPLKKYKTKKLKSQEN